MNSFKPTIFLLLLLNSLNVYCQDTISIFFEFGKSKILESQSNTLNLIPRQFDLSELDSVNYIGVSDSVGKFDSNLKLSRKRAIETMKYCEAVFPKNYLFKITAIGERTKMQSELNRRVDIVLYFKNDKINIDEITENINSIYGCYYIDYKLLHRSHLRKITQKKTDFIIIETNNNDLKKLNLHYYLTSTRNGKAIIKKVKWGSKKTGKLWWSNYRFVATIPKSDFETFKIFQIGGKPCSECAEDIKFDKNQSKEDNCMQLDRFLMENIQVKTKLFNKKMIKIRAPKEFVDIEDKYYIGCSYDLPLYWETQSGRRKKNYYYSQLPHNNVYLKNIVRKMECCKANPEPSECEKGIIKCRTLMKGDKSFLLYGEAGNNYQFSENIPYLTFGVSKSGDYSQSMLLLGTDTKLNFYSSLKYQFNFISFPFSILNPVSSWQSPNNVGYVNKYGRLYIGSEIKTRLNNNYPELIEQNIHVGLSRVNALTNAFIPKIFFQYGIGLDYSGNYSTKPYSIFQIGLNVRIARLGKQL